MTNYNDGKWHGWSGGECPVDPECTVVGIYMADGKVTPESPVTDYAGQFDWNREASYELVAFRVVKEYREPREFWITIYDGMAWDTSAQAEQHNANLPDGGSQIIHVREVSK